MSMFKRGYKEVEAEAERQQKVRDSMGKKLWRFFLSKDGEEAQVRFLTEEPINFYEHTIEVNRNGKTMYDNTMCTQEGCPLCDSGNRPSFKSAFLIYDKREVEITDKQTNKKKTIKGQLRLYVQGTKVASQLKRLSERYGLTGRDYIITRSGRGTSTSYMFDRTDETSKLTQAEITNMLPESLRKDYNGTADSLYDILEGQLSGELDEAEGTDTTYSTATTASQATKNLVGVDRDEEEAPKKKVAHSPFKRTKVENSAKALFKKTK